MGGADAPVVAEPPVVASADLGALGPGVWVELSVAADIEAVEAVS